MCPLKIEATDHVKKFLKGEIGSDILMFSGSFNQNVWLHLIQTLKPTDKKYIINK